MSALKGRILEGGQGCQYRVEEPLDLDELGSPKGAMARVFRVLELQNDQQRAAKIINPRLLDDEPGIRKRFLAQFYKEARIMEELQHPNIVRLYDYNTENELPFLIMDYIEGETLDDRLRRQGRFSFQEALAILEPVIMALAYAHSRGVIHRDIKPSNILLDWHGKAYLSDFGIARAAQESGLSSRTALTLGPYQFGTPMYMAPEQALRLSEAVGPQTDQYSLAVLVWRMLAGRYYLARADSKEAIDYSKLVIGGSPLPLSRYAPNLPPRAEQAIVKALTKSPYERFDSVLDFLDELRNALNDPDGMPPSNPLLGWEEPEWLVPPIPLASSKKEWEEPEWLNPAEASSREKGWEESEWLSPEDLKAKAKQWEESEWLKPAEHLAEGWEAPTWFNFTAQKVEQKLETLPPPTLTPVEPAPSTASALEQEEDEEDLGWLDSLKLDDDHLEDFTFSNVEQIEQNRAVLTPVNVEEKPATEPLDLTLPEWFNGDAATPAPPRTLSSASSAHSPVLPAEAKERKSQPLPPLREKGSGSQPLREKGSQPLPSFETRERESQPLPPLREKGNGSQPLRAKGNGSQPLREKGN
ncbi:MAG: serine/threonine-protein kinase, partial [Chloroflexota bacterium]